MKLGELERYLSQLETFSKPKVELEQYHTSAHIAARMLFAAQDKIEGSLVCDLGSGCGVLALGSILCGASFVCGLEIDADAIEIALENSADLLDEDMSTRLEFVQTRVQDFSKIARLNDFFDVIIMNPPYGTKASVGADFEFLQTGLQLVRDGGHIFSLHKTSTRQFFEKKIKEFNLEGKVLAQVSFDIPKIYKFHKEKSRDIEVDFWEFFKKQ